MENITLSADERLIEAARARAKNEHTTLNEQFQHWLERYTYKEKRVEKAMALLEELRTRIHTGGQRFSRDEMNER